MNGQRAMKRVRWHTYKCMRLAHIVGSVGEVSGIGSAIIDDGRCDERGGGVTIETR